MFTKSYAAAEMKQRRTAANTGAAARASDASRQNALHGATAKGQSEQNYSQTSHTADTQMQFSTPDEWASECLFDCYNG